MQQLTLLSSIASNAGASGNGATIPITPGCFQRSRGRARPGTQHSNSRQGWGGLFQAVETEDLMTGGEPTLKGGEAHTASAGNLAHRRT